MNFIKPLFLFIFLSFSFSALGQERQPFTANDLVTMKRVSAPAVSPDGRTVAFVVRETDMTEDRGRTDVWLLDLGNAGAGPMRLTTHPENDTAPKWSGDSRYVYFLSSRSESAQVWRIPVAGGEAQQVTDFPVDVGTFKLSPDGAKLAFTALVFPDCLTLECTANRQALEDDDPEKGIVYDKLIMRFWDAWRDGRRPQLFVTALEGGRAAGEPRNLTRGLQAAVPAYPFIGADAYAFTGDGREVVFSTKILDENESWSVNSDLYRVRVDGKRGVENLTRANRGGDFSPVVSPDGRWLAWLSTQGETRWAGPSRVKLMNLKNGDTRTLAPGWDFSPGAIAFSPDSSALYATTDYFGQRVLWRIALAGGSPERITDQGRVEGFAPARDGVVYAKSMLAAPADLYYAQNYAQGGSHRAVTGINADVLAAIEFGDYEQFSFEGAHGDTVYGYVVHPAGYSQRRKYPVAFIIHGGPHGSMGNSFHYRWNPQVYAGAGYAAVFIDFHGSTGYGQAFTESIHGDRGGATLEDLQKGLAAALARYPWLDGDRVCALGASFGGYMVNWIAGAWPDRFRCLVNHDGMFDNRMKYFSGDIIGYLEEGFGGKPYFEDQAGHESFNPANLVANWQTPMLVIHGEKDYRVPITHGIGAFTAAQRKGIESRFLYFPDENHWVLKPNNSVQWHREVIRWLDRWLKR